MALSGIKFNTGFQHVSSNHFPSRRILTRRSGEKNATWLLAHKKELRRRFKAVLCSKRFKDSQTLTDCKHFTKIKTTKDQLFNKGNNSLSRTGVFDGFFLLRHCCVDDPTDLCSINIAGLSLSEMKEDDFDIFDNVVYIDAGDNHLKLEPFCYFPSLRELELPLNGLHNFNSLQLSDFSELEVLDVSYNNLSQSDILAIGNIPKLHVLHLTGNQLQSLPPEMSLLDFSGRCALTQRFRQLEVLLLDDNKFCDSSVFTALAGLPKLKHINMERNELFTIPPLKFENGWVIAEDDAFKPAHCSISCLNSGLDINSVQLASHKISLPCRDNVQSMPHIETDETVDNDESIMHDSSSFHFENQAKGHKMELNALLTDDFNLGALDKCIMELEDNVSGSMMQETVSTSYHEPRSCDMSPFPELGYLNISHNQISDEAGLLSVACWPALMHLVIHHNPLVKSRKICHPLLQQLLSDRLGIKIQRVQSPPLLKPNLHINRGKLKFLHKTKPKIQKSDIDEQLQQLTLSSGQLRCEQAEYLCSTSDQAVQQDGGLELSGKRYFRQKDQYSTSLHVRNPFSRHQLKATLPHRVKESVEKAANSATFFLTQVEDLEEGQHIEDADVEACCRDPSELQDIVNHCKTSVEEQYRGCELLLEVDSADGKLPLHLPEDIHGSVIALKHALKTALVYHDDKVHLHRIKRDLPKYGKDSKQQSKFHKPRQERIDEMLAMLRTCSAAVDENLADILGKPYQHPRLICDAKLLLSQVQQRYNAVRVSSIKRAVQLKST